MPRPRWSTETDGPVRRRRPVIIVSRLNGDRFGLNAEHIEKVEETPDTVLSMLDGRKYIIRESLDILVGIRLLAVFLAERPFQQH